MVASHDQIMLGGIVCALRSDPGGGPYKLKRGAGAWGLKMPVAAGPPSVSIRFDRYRDCFCLMKNGRALVLKLKLVPALAIGQLFAWKF